MIQSLGDLLPCSHVRLHSHCVEEGMVHSGLGVHNYTSLHEHNII